MKSAHPFLISLLVVASMPCVPATALAQAPIQEHSSAKSSLDDARRAADYTRRDSARAEQQEQQAEQHAKRAEGSLKAAQDDLAAARKEQQAAHARLSDARSAEARAQRQLDMMLAQPR
jgi:hypothetical protein